MRPLNGGSGLNISAQIAPGRAERVGGGTEQQVGTQTAANDGKPDACHTMIRYRSQLACVVLVRTSHFATLIQRAIARIFHEFRSDITLTAFRHWPYYSGSYSRLQTIGRPKTVLRGDLAAVGLLRPCAGGKLISHYVRDFHRTPSSGPAPVEAPTRRGNG